MKENPKRLRLYERSGQGDNEARPNVKAVALVDAEKWAYTGYLVEDTTLEALIKAASKYEFPAGNTSKETIKNIEFIPGGYDALETEIEYCLLQISELSTSANWLMDAFRDDMRREQYTKATTLVEAIEDKLNRVKNYLGALQERHIDEKYNIEGLPKNGL